MNANERALVASDRSGGGASELLTEVSRKLSFIRDVLRQSEMHAVHFRGVDWFSWMTCGASSCVIMTNEVGVAEVLVTLNEAWILTNRIEHNRMLEDELPTEVLKEFRVSDFPWTDSEATQKFVFEKSGGANARIASDRPARSELALPSQLTREKMILQPAEIQRHREISRMAAEAMTEALEQATPEWTERRLAGAGAEALWSRGLEPTLILVSGHDRGEKFRHPLAKNVPLGESAMMVFCARGFGLFANLTRFVYFREPSAVEAEKFAKLAKIEAAAFKSTRIGSRLSQSFNELQQAYSLNGCSEQLERHHQGGITGYLSRECIARPELNAENDVQYAAGMTFAWNPSLPGAKCEDTVLLTENGLEVLTVDQKWPSKEISGLLRPQIWVRK